MSKEQEYIVLIFDKDGNQIDFERWSCKRASTVRAGMKKLEGMSLWNFDLKNRAVRAECWKTTPEGTHLYLADEWPMFEKTY